MNLYRWRYWFGPTLLEYKTWADTEQEAKRLIGNRLYVAGELTNMVACILDRAELEVIA